MRTFHGYDILFVPFDFLEKLVAVGFDSQQMCHNAAIGTLRRSILRIPVGSFLVVLRIVNLMSQHFESLFVDFQLTLPASFSETTVVTLWVVPRSHFKGFQWLIQLLVSDGLWRQYFVWAMLRNIISAVDAFDDAALIFHLWQFVRVSSLFQHLYRCSYVVHVCGVFVAFHKFGVPLWRVGPINLFGGWFFVSMGYRRWIYYHCHPLLSIRLLSHVTFIERQLRKLYSLHTVAILFFISFLHLL